MSKSFVVYQSQDGSTTDYAVPFEYLDKSFVKAYVGGAAASFTFVSTYMIRFAVAPVGDLKLYRETSKELLNSYSNGSILDANDLNVSFYQTLHIAQEISDNTLQNSPDGGWNVDGLRVTTVGDPVEPLDAVNKQWAETAHTSTLANAIIAKDRAVLAEGTAYNEAERAKREADRSAAQAVIAKDAANSILGAVTAATTQATRAADQAAVAVDAAEQAVSNTAIVTAFIPEVRTAVTRLNNIDAQVASAAASASTATSRASAANTSANQAKGFRDETEDLIQAALAGFIPPDMTVALTKADNLASVADPVVARRNLKMWTGTIAQYNALSTKDATTIYFCTDD